MPKDKQQEIRSLAQEANAFLRILDNERGIFVQHEPSIMLHQANANPGEPETWCAAVAYLRHLAPDPLTAMRMLNKTLAEVTANVAGDRGSSTQGDQ